MHKFLEKRYKAKISMMIKVSKSFDKDILRCRSFFLQGSCSTKKWFNKQIFRQGSSSKCIASDG